MKNKKSLFIILLTVTISIIIFEFDNKDKANDLNKKLEYEKEGYIDNIKPISKENAVKILKAEYGDLITISKEDIQKVEDEYVIDVRIGEMDEEEHNHQDDAVQPSLGIHKINIYTGELIFPE